MMKRMMRTLRVVTIEGLRQAIAGMESNDQNSDLDTVEVPPALCRVGRSLNQRFKGGAIWNL
jgi:hypothetical protein